jgi:hypothetical protein
VLPQQASRQSPTDGTSSAARARRFPQPVWTTPCRTPWRVLRPSHRRLPSEQRRAPLTGAASHWRRAVAGGRGSRTCGFPGTPGRAAGSGPAGTALRRQGRVVTWPLGPRHHRPRLRHAAHRRGEASAASRPRKAHARAVIKVCLSAQRSADRSVWRLQQRHRRTAPASHWAARHCSSPPSARQRARTDAAPCLTSSPPEGHQRKAPAPRRSARAMDASRPLTPARGLCQSLRSWRSAAVPLLPRVLCGLSSLLASVRTVMPEGSCVKARPRGVHQQDGHRGLAASASQRAGQASLDAGGPQSQALRVTGDRRRAHVPDAAQAWAGGQRGGTRAPTPLAGRCAPWLDERSFIRAVCCRVASRASAPAQAGSGPAGEAGGSAALPCVPWQPQAAAGCCGVFLPPQKAQGNPGGATSRAGLAALGAHAHP